MGSGGILQEVSRKKKTGKSKKAKPTAYYRDGEVVGEAVPYPDDDSGEYCRTVMVLCPDALLKEINILSDFNYIERSDFVTVAAQQLLDYLDASNSEELAALVSDEPWDDADADSILMSAERYPYEEEDEEFGVLWAAEDDGDAADDGPEEG